MAIDQKACQVWGSTWHFTGVVDLLAQLKQRQPTRGGLVVLVDVGSVGTLSLENRAGRSRKDARDAPAARAAGRSPANGTVAAASRRNLRDGSY